MADAHRTCRQCGDQFVLPTGKGRKPVYCSPDCREAGRAEQSKEHSRATQEKLSAAKKDAVHSCKKCGRGFKGRKRKFCCKRCGQLARTKTGKTVEQIRAESRDRATKVCQHCGDTYLSKRRRQDEANKFCSFGCYVSELRLNKKGPFCSVSFCSCASCNGLFAARSSSARYCSDACRKTMACIKAREKSERDHRPRTVCCGECGNAFTTEYGSKRRRFCSDMCLKRNVNRARRHIERARLRDAKVESVDPIAVFVRDGWRCQMCGVKTPRRLRGAAVDRAPELDHIKPLAKGGDHGYVNTQCACRKCNREKSDSEVGQMRLIG